MENTEGKKKYLFLFSTSMAYEKKNSGWMGSIVRNRIWVSSQMVSDVNFRDNFIWVSTSGDRKIEILQFYWRFLHFLFLSFSVLLGLISDEFDGSIHILIP